MTRNIFLVLLFLCSPAWAMEGINWNGFFTVGVQALETEIEQPYSSANRSYLTKETNFNNLTRIGLNVSAEITEDISFAGQLVGRGINFDSYVSADWMFLTYQPTDNLYFRAGKTRINLWTYSEYPDVGRAYVHAELPEEVYSFFPIKSMYGVSTGYTRDIGDINFNLELGRGSLRTEVAENPSPQSKFTSENFKVANLSVGNPYLTLRAAMAQANYLITNREPNIETESTLTSFGISSEVGNFVFVAEAVQINSVNDTADAAATQAAATQAGQAVGVAQQRAITTAADAAAKKAIYDADTTNTANQAAYEAAEVTAQAASDQLADAIADSVSAGIANTLASRDAEGMKAHYATLGYRFFDVWLAYVTMAEIDIPENGAWLGDQTSTALGFVWEIDFNTDLKLEAKSIKVGDDGPGLFENFARTPMADDKAMKYTMTIDVLF